MEICLLGLLLLLERKVESASEWAEYMSSLPWGAASSHLPLMWLPAHLARELQGAAPQHGIEAKRKELAAAYASLLPHCKKASKKAHSQLVRACPAESDFIAAFALVHSRAMNVPTTDSDGHSWQLVILPFADMFNHCSEPELEWDVEAGGRSVVGRVVRDVEKGAELRIRYQGEASAQAFFATYGFVEGGTAAPSELVPFWDGPGSDVTVRFSSNESIRQLLSCLRVAAASPEERQRLRDDTPSEAARVPLSAACERAVMEQLRAHVARANLEDAADACSTPAAALRRASQAGWERLDHLAASVLDAMKSAGREYKATELAVLVHKMIRASTNASSKSSVKEYLNSDMMRIRDCGGVKGRGYFATADIAPGTLLLCERPHVLDAAEADFPGLAAVLALGLASGDCELRPAPSKTVPGPREGEEVMRWLRGVEGVTAEAATRALAAAKNNGFCTTLVDASENEPMLLFKRLCIFNHSCVPNCGVYRDGERARVLAIRPVKKGEELTIHYLDELQTLPTALRRPFLKGRFGFECDCERCEAEEEDAGPVEAALARRADGCSGADAAARLHAMRRAHATLCHMQTQDGMPVGFSFKSFDDWSAALAAVDAALPDISAYGAETFWARHHACALRCLALEGLGRDAVAFLALAEHAAVAWRLLPRHCDALRELQDRLDRVRGRLPSALAPRLEQKADGLCGDALRGLAKDVSTLRGWLVAGEPP